jgi:hypothetical protein
MTKHNQTSVIVGLVCMAAIPICFAAFLLVVFMAYFLTTSLNVVPAIDLKTTIDLFGNGIKECTMIALIAEIFLLIIVLTKWDIKRGGEVDGTDYRRSDQRNDQHFDDCENGCSGF